MFTFPLLFVVVVVAPAFSDASAFNRDIAAWDVSQVTTMYQSKWTSGDVCVCLGGIGGWGGEVEAAYSKAGISPRLTPPPHRLTPLPRSFPPHIGMIQ